MKNLLAYTPETFDNLELENFEYAPLADEMDMEEGFVRGKQSRPRVARAKGMSPRIASSLRKPSRIPLLPQIPPPADDRRPSGQSSSSGNAGGEGSFANAPAQALSSEHVRWVQETLNRALGLRLMVDGIMNRETRSAVRMFQERKGLPVTGLVGPDTEEALRAEGGQAAVEPELLEGEGMLAFEAEPFIYEYNWELEDEVTHHLIPQEFLRHPRTEKLVKMIIENSDMNQPLQKDYHKLIHNNGYNRKWWFFFKNNKSAKPGEIKEFARKMRRYIKANEKPYLKNKARTEKNMKLYFSREYEDDFSSFPAGA